MIANKAWINRPVVDIPGSIRELDVK